MLQIELPQNIEKTIIKNGYDLRLKRENKKYKLYFKTQQNRIGIIYKISAVLYIKNWNILEMNAILSENGVVETTFLIEPIEKSPPFFYKWALLKDINQLLNTDINVMTYVSKFPEKWNVLHEQKQGNPVKLAVKNNKKEGGYDLFIETRDRPGLIFEITQILYRMYFNIVKMESVTRNSRAYDRILVIRDPDKAGKNDGDLLTDALGKILG